jgi:hypothetical protein
MLVWPSGAFSYGRGVKVALSFRTNNRVVIALFRRVRKMAQPDYWLRHVCMSARLSARINYFVSIGRIFTKCCIWVFLENVTKKIQVSLIFVKNNGGLV